MRFLFAILFTTLSILFAALSVDVTAQGPDTVQEAARLKEELETARKEKEALQRQLANAKLTPEEQRARAVSAYRKLFDDARRDAEQGCREAGGKVKLVTVTPGQMVQVSVSCEF